VRREDQHRFRHGAAQAADGMADLVVPLTLDRLDKGIPPLRVLQRDVEMHAGPGVILVRLGHETGGAAM